MDNILEINDRRHRLAIAGMNWATKNKPMRANKVIGNL
jgi:hypothetical protein